MSAPNFQQISDSPSYFRGISEVLKGKKIKDIVISEDFRALRVICEDDSKLEIESPEELTVFRLDKDDQIVNQGALEFFKQMSLSWEY